MNRAIRRISLAVAVMFVLLLANINYLQAFEAGSLSAKPGNGRAFAAQYQNQRGQITTSGGQVIAESKYIGGTYKYQRYYPSGPEYAPVTGYDSLYSATGVERAYNAYLAGSSSKLAVRNVIDMITGKPQKGATVQTTISSKAQAAAYRALASSGREGAAVAINPHTGAILAMASDPSFDPNELSVLNGTQLNQNANRLNAEQSQPLLNRAISATYPPGSTFKIVTSAAAMTDGHYNSQSSVYSPTTLNLPQTSHTLSNNNGEACGNGSGHAPLIVAFAQSCDTTFGNLGMTVGAQALGNMAAKFGMNSSSLTIPMPVARSNYVVPDSPALTAYSAIGQYSDTVTPLQDAMFSAAIANGGQLMRPYLVQQVQASDLNVVYQAAPSVLSQPVTADVAGQIKQMMTQVVNSPAGTAHQVADNVIPGVQIAAKTGTAQNGLNNTGLDDAVFTCFAPASNPTIAVGVVIQGGGYGAAAAAPIAISILKAYLENG